MHYHTKNEVQLGAPCSTIWKRFFVGRRASQVQCCSAVVNIFRIGYFRIPWCFCHVCGLMWRAHSVILIFFAYMCSTWLSTSIVSNAKIIVRHNTIPTEWILCLIYFDLIRNFWICFAFKKLKKSILNPQMRIVAFSNKLNMCFFN